MAEQHANAQGLRTTQSKCAKFSPMNRAVREGNKTTSGEFGFNSCLKSSIIDSQYDQLSTDASCLKTRGDQRIYAERASPCKQCAVHEANLDKLNSDNESLRTRLDLLRTVLVCQSDICKRIQKFFTGAFAEITSLDFDLKALQTVR